MRGFIRRLEGDQIDARLAAEVRGRLRTFHVLVKELPEYRFVDLYETAVYHAGGLGITATIESDHREES
jgi:hypothetical protein